MGEYDAEAPPYVTEGFNCFDDKAIRRGFIRKVFLILGFQLAVVTSMVFITMLVPDVRGFINEQDNFDRVTLPILITSLVVYFVSVLVLVCAPGLRRRHPINIILLFVFTLSSGVLISIICSTYTVDSVMLALGITVMCCVGIFVFSFNTKYDLSSCHGLVFCLLWGLLLTGFLLPITGISASNKVYAGFGAIIFMFVLIYDIHRIMGRSAENAISSEEYVVAALEVYLDIINIFLKILQIVGKR